MLDTLHQFRSKKVFITGHTGFKGAWLLKLLYILGAEVRGYALEPETPADLFNLISGPDLCESIIGDLRDKERLTQAVLDFKPDYIFHLAAQPLVRLSYEMPSETFEINAIGTANLLDAVRFLEKRCAIVLITTDKVYHNNEWAYPYREIDRLGGYDPYSASKACAELVIDSYRNSFFNISNYPLHQKSIAVARAGNVIGGGDWAKDRLIPDIVKALSKSEKVVIRNPSAVRPWQHVLEPLSGYLLLALHAEKEPEKFNTAFNFGPGAEDALPVSEMVKLSIQAWGSGAYVVDSPAEKLHEAGLLKLDISKANRELGWVPKFKAAEAITKTIEWYQSFKHAPGTISGFTEMQATDFLALHNTTP